MADSKETKLLSCWSCEFNENHAYEIVPESITRNSCDEMIARLIVKAEKKNK